MKKIFILTVMMILLSSCTTEQKEVVEINENTYKLQSEVFAEKLELVWEIIPNKEVPVSFKQNGRISNLNVDIWDYVLKNAFLWNLSWDEININNLTNSINEQNINNTYEYQKEVLNNNILLAQKAVEVLNAQLLSAKNTVKTTSTLTGSQKDLSKKQLEKAEINLENVQNNVEQNIDSVYKNAKSTIVSALISSNNANNFADKILWISNQYKNSNKSFENNLWALNTTSKSIAETDLKLSLKYKDEFQVFYSENIENNQNISNDEFDEYLEKSLEMLEKTQQMLKSFYEMLNSTSTGSSLTETTLQAFKQEALTHGQRVEQSIMSSSGNIKLWVKGLILTILEINTQNEIDLKNANSNLETAKQSLNQSIASSSKNNSDATWNITVLNKQLEQAELNLQNAKKQKELVLSQLKSQINSIKGQKLISQSDVLNTQIISPFNWIVSEKYVEVWQVVQTWQPIFQVSDISKFKIKTTVSDINLNKLKINSKAIINIDGIKQNYNAVVTKIYPTVDTVTKKTIIELTILDSDNQIRIWMFTRINLFLNEDKNSFFIPKSYLFSSFEWPYVLEEKWKKIFVSTGLEKGNLIKIWFEWNMENIIIKQ